MSDKINQDLLKSLFNYDPSTGIFIRLVNAGGCAKAGDIVGSNDLYGYKTVRIFNKSYKLHRLAWIYVNGCDPVGDIDHINGNRADNRILNLRDVSRKVNLQNQRKSKNNKSTGILGVYADLRRKGFIACISIDNKKKHLGTFKTIELATEAYLSAKRLMHEGCTI